MKFYPNWQIAQQAAKPKKPPRQNYRLQSKIMTNIQKNYRFVNRNRQAPGNYFNSSSGDFTHALGQTGRNFNLDEVEPSIRAYLQESPTSVIPSKHFLITHLQGSQFFDEKRTSFLPPMKNVPSQHSLVKQPEINFGTKQKNALNQQRRRGSNQRVTSPQSIPQLPDSRWVNTVQQDIWVS